MDGCLILCKDIRLRLVVLNFIPQPSMYEDNPNSFVELVGLRGSLHYDIGGSHLQISKLMWQRSLIWQRNNNGPSTVPCGTLESAVHFHGASPSKIPFDAILSKLM